MNEFSFFPFFLSFFTQTMFQEFPQTHKKQNNFENESRKNKKKIECFQTMLIISEILLLHWWFDVYLFVVVVLFHWLSKYRWITVAVVVADDEGNHQWINQNVRFFFVRWFVCEFQIGIINKHYIFVCLYKGIV